MTGETASGRSMSALSTRLPWKSYRTSSSAATTPKTVLASTAQNAMTAVSWNAWMVASVVRPSMTGPMPFSNVRQKINATGMTSRNVR